MRRLRSRGWRPPCSASVRPRPAGDRQRRRDHSAGPRCAHWAARGPSAFTSPALTPEAFSGLLASGHRSCRPPERRAPLTIGRGGRSSALPGSARRLTSRKMHAVAHVQRQVDGRGDAVALAGRDGLDVGIGRRDRRGDAREHAALAGDIDAHVDREITAQRLGPPRSRSTFPDSSCSRRRCGSSRDASTTPRPAVR